MRPAAVLSLALLLCARRLDAVTTPLTPHSPLLHTPHLHSPWPHVPRRCAIALKGPPPIASRYFESLLTPAQFEELLEKAPSDAVSIIKFQATYCRTCRATAPLLDRVAKKYPTAKFYDLTLARDGKAAGERMYRFFKSRGIKEMPYVEVYAGSERVEAEVVVPSGIERLQQMIAAAQERLTAGVWRGQRARLLQLQREFRNARRPKKERDAAEGGAAQSGRKKSAPELAAAAWAQRGGGGGAVARSKVAPQRSAAPRRGPPLRGATGGRRVSQARSSRRG